LAPAVLSHAGLHITALLRAERDEDQVCAAAAASGIATTGLRRYFHGRPGRPGVVMGFGAIDTGELPADLTAPRGALVG
jgi:GntR family transcriptional regulator/MocR family aminotransferase